MKTASFTVYTAQDTNGAWFGRISGPGIKSPLFFDDLHGMLLQLDAHMDENNYPRAYQRKRRFTPPKPLNPGTEKHADYSRVFILYIKSRQNAGWQGALDWRNKQPMKPFSSELELLRLLRSGL